MSSVSDRLRRWMRSDLIGIPVMLLAAGIALLSILAIYLGPVRGLVFSSPLWGIGLYLAIRGGREPAAIDDLAGPPGGDRHRVLVVANRGLAEPALCDQVCRRAERPRTDVMVLAPVVASSRIRTLADDFDAESRAAGERVERALAIIRGRGVRASGRVAGDADPMQALLDGIREFPADVVMLTGAEPGWDRAGSLAERVRREVGLAVIEVEAEGRAPAASADDPNRPELGPTSSNDP